MCRFHFPTILHGGADQVIFLRQAIMDAYNNKKGFKSQKQIQGKLKINHKKEKKNYSFLVT